MSGLPIPDLGSLGKSLKDFIDYWKNFKNKRIRIIGPSSSSLKDGEHGIEFRVFKEIIEGKVDSVQAYPPGIILNEIEQFVRHEWDLPLYSIEQEDPLRWLCHGADSTEKEILDVKFVSFNFISAVEFLET